MKRLLRIIFIGIGLGILLSLIQRVFQIETHTFLRGYWMIAPALVVGAILINVLYNLHYHRKMRDILTLLKEGRAADYVDAMEALIQTAKGTRLKDILRLNLSAGYCELKQFDTAVRILEALPYARFQGAVKLVYCLNLCVSYFHTTQWEKALALYRENEPLIARYRTGPYGGNVAELDIIAAILAGQFDQAEHLIASARTAWEDPRLQEDYCQLESILADARQKS